MTNGWVDIKNTDMMLIVVDPRFQRTASQADLFCQIRAGSDIAFLGGLLNYAIQNNRYNKEYVANYTNAALIVKKGFKLPEDGLFSGYDLAAMKYDVSSWNYEEGGNMTGTAAAAIAAGDGPATEDTAKTAAPGNPASNGAKAAGPRGAEGQGIQGMGPGSAKGSIGTAPAAPSLPPNTAYDLSLEHPRCVFQLMKKQYSRYTPEMVSRITGIDAEQCKKAWEMYTSVRKDGDMKKAATIIYAVGWTQHTFGTQIIRTAAMVQLLMGDVGRAGGGVNAMRGHSNIQGATDMAGVFDILPGYLKVPVPTDKDFNTYIARSTPKASKPKEWDSYNYWSNTPKFAV